MEEFTIKNEIKDISRKTLFGPVKVKDLVISTYYDLHGMIIDNDDTTHIRNKTIQIDEHIYNSSAFGRMESWELFIDGVKYTECEVTQMKGNANRLLIMGCSGCG